MNPAAACIFTLRSRHSSNNSSSNRPWSLIATKGIKLPSNNTKCLHRSKICQYLDLFIKQLFLKEHSINFINRVNVTCLCLCVYTLEAAFRRRSGLRTWVMDYSKCITGSGTLVCFIFNQKSKFWGEMLRKPENQTSK